MAGFANTVGARMLPVPAGSFCMGRGDGLPIEGPKASVTLTQGYYLGETPVTNAQYELFDPSHRLKRSWVPFSQGDEDAALFITWHEAQAFVRWLSKREGRRYMLPTEAQWEYAARTGGEGEAPEEGSLRNQRESWYPDKDHYDPQDELVRLPVRQGKPNALGLYDMQGLVEEWCEDAFARYSGAPLTDPIASRDGAFRMTRGGSHSTDAKYLRTTMRMGTLPDDCSWVIGMRLCMMEEERVAIESGIREEHPLHQTNVSQDSPIRSKIKEPCFAQPKPFVRMTADPARSFYAHNHGPSVVECPNGDLLVAWFSCPRESGREMSILASRLRYGAKEWDEASAFWAPPERGASCTVLVEKDGVLYHFNGVSVCATWANVALCVRSSLDNGATWSDMRVIQPRHDIVLMPSGGDAVVLADGRIAMPADDISVDNSVSGCGGSVLVTWNGEQQVTVLGGSIPGIHAPLVERRDGGLLAYGRGSEIEGCMPTSLSMDGGKTYMVTKSEFPGIGMGQRAVLRRLHSGAIFFASFASHPFDCCGKHYAFTGLYGALSYDEGETWPVVRLLAPDGFAGQYEGGAWTGQFVLDEAHGEPRGYLTCVVARDGVIHLLSSGIHYAFNQPWLERKNGEERKDDL